MASHFPNAPHSVTWSAAEMAGAAAQAYPPPETGITTPPPQDFDTPAMAGSMQQFLADNLGEYVIIEFLVGTQALVQKAGVLYAVGSGVVTLYEEVSQTYVTCDMFAVKFVTFFLPGHRPWQAGGPTLPGSTASPAQGARSVSQGMGGGCIGGY